MRFAAGRVYSLGRRSSFGYYLTATAAYCHRTFNIDFKLPL